MSPIGSRFQFSGRATRPLGALLIAAAAVVPSLAAQTLPMYTVREEWRIVSNETTRDMQLTNVVGFTVLPDGRIVTTHRTEPMVRVFDSTGRFIRTVGRRGQGPGEFASIFGPTRVGWVGDTVWIRDDQRLKLFNRDFVPIGQLAAPTSSGQFLSLMSGGKLFGVFAPVPGDSRAVAIDGKFGPSGPPVIDSRSIARGAAPPSGPAPTIPVRSVRQMLEIIREGEPTTTVAPFSAMTTVALAPGGREAAVIEPARIWNGRPGQFTIRRVTPDWRLSDPVTVSLTPRRLTKQTADSTIAEWARIRSAGPEVQRRIELPEYLNPFVSVEYYGDGLLWIDEDVRGDTRLVVGVDGRPRMRVRVPPALYIHYATSTHVWGTLVDADDLPIIVKYRLVPP